jgi:hypothetical protein
VDLTTIPSVLSYNFHENVYLEEIIENCILYFFPVEPDSGGN